MDHFDENTIPPLLTRIIKSSSFGAVLPDSFHISNKHICYMLYTLGYNKRENMESILVITPIIN